MKKLLIFIKIFIFTAFLNAQQTNFQWAKQIGGGHNDYVFDTKLDASGNVYSVGFFINTADLDPGTGTQMAVSNGNQDIFIIKQDNAGNLIWAKNVGGTGYDIPYSLDLDASGNIFVTGEFANTVDFNPGIGINNLSCNGDNDIFVLKLDNSGNYVWAQSYGDASTDIGQILKVDKVGNVIVYGVFRGTVDFDFSASTLNLTAPFSNYNAFLLKLDGNTGACIWVKNTAISMANKNNMDLDNNNNIFLVGSFEGTIDFDPGIGVFNLTSNGSGDIIVMNLNSNGNFIWAKKIGGSLGDGSGVLKIDKNDELNISGTFTGTVNFDPLGGSTSAVLTSTNSVFLLKLKNNGDYKWVKQINNSAASYHSPKAIGIDDNENNYYTSQYVGSVNINSGGTYTASSPSSTSFSNYIIKLDKNGNLVWGKNYNDWGTMSLNTDVNFNIFKSGFFSSSVDFDPNASTYNLTSFGLADGFIHKLAQCTTIPAPPTNTTPASSLVACNGASVNLTASAIDATINWYSTATSSTILGSGNSYLTPILTTGTYTYYAEAVNPCGVSTRTAITITVNTNTSPIATISTSSPTICQGKTSILTASGGGTYAWNNSMGSSAIISVSPVSNITYTVTITAANGCTASANTTINVLPTASINPTNVSICKIGQSVTLNANGGGTYMWSHGLGTSSSVIVNPLSNTIYTVTVTNSLGCTSTASSSISINPLNVMITGNQVLCGKMTSVDLSTNYFGANYIWSTGSVNSTITVTTPGKYKVTVTNLQGCQGVDSVTVLGCDTPTVCDNPPNCLLNGDITGPNPHTCPMNTCPSTIVPDWYVSHDPSIPYVLGSIVGLQSSSSNESGIFTCFNFQAGKTYKVCINSTDNYNGTGYLSVNATTGLVQGFGVATPTPTTIQHIGNANFPVSVWGTTSITFTANANFNQLWLNAICYSTISSYITNIDFVHVEEVVTIPITITTSGPIVAGSPLTLTASGTFPAGATYHWSNGNTGKTISIIPTCSKIDYTVTVYFNNCSVPTGIPPYNYPTINGACPLSSNATLSIQAVCEPITCCGSWNSVELKDYDLKIIDSIPCDTNIIVRCGGKYALSFMYKCKPGCSTYQYVDVFNAKTGGYLYSFLNGYSQAVTIPSTGSGSLLFKYRVACGDSTKFCDSCKITLDYNCDTPKTCCGSLQSIVLSDFSTSQNLHCGDIVTVKCNKDYKIGFSYTCQDSCSKKDSIFLYDHLNNIIIGKSGSNINPFQTPSSGSGTYKILYKVYCGDKLCQSCDITLNYNCDTATCCGNWEGIKTTTDFKNGSRPMSNTYQCNDTVSFDCEILASITGNFKYKCKDTCEAYYKTIITDPNGVVTQYSYNSYLLNIDKTTMPINGLWKIKSIVYCGDTSVACDTCILYVNVKCDTCSLDIDITGDTYICEMGSSKLTAKILKKGSGIITYKWSTNETNPSIIVTEAKRYYVTVCETTGGEMPIIICCKVDSFDILDTCTKCNDTCDWHTAGNMNIMPWNFIGPRNAEDFRIRTNNMPAVTISNQNVGTDNAKLLMQPNISWNATPNTSSVIGVNSVNNNDQRLRITAGNSDPMNGSNGAAIDLHGNNTLQNQGRVDLVSGSSASGINTAVSIWTYPTTGIQQQSINVTGDGMVGIGNNIAPTHLLHIDGNARVTVMPTKQPEDAIVFTARQNNASTEGELRELPISNNMNDYLAGDGTWHKIPTSPTITNLLKNNNNNTMTSTVNGQASTADIITNNNIIYNSTTNTLTSDVNGVKSTTNALPFAIGNFWSLVGNSGTFPKSTTSSYSIPFTATENFIGTTDNKRLVFGTGGTAGPFERMTIFNNTGNVGIGTNVDGGYKLGVMGSVKLQGNNGSGYSSYFEHLPQNNTNGNLTTPVFKLRLANGNFGMDVYNGNGALEPFTLGFANSGLGFIKGTKINLFEIDGLWTDHYITYFKSYNNGGFGLKDRVSNVVTFEAKANKYVWGTNLKVGGNTDVPNNKVEITHGTSGNSGLRFTNLISGTSTTTNNANKVLSVTSLGDVVLVNAQAGPQGPAGTNGTNGTSAADQGTTLDKDGVTVNLGDYCGGNRGLFKDNREINMDNFNLYFNSGLGDLSNGKLYMGGNINQKQCKPLNTRLEISSEGLYDANLKIPVPENSYNTPNPSLSGLRFTNLKANDNPIPNISNKFNKNGVKGVLSLDEEGDVIWVEACCSSNGVSAIDNEIAIEKIESQQVEITTLKSELELMKEKFALLEKSLAVLCESGCAGLEKFGAKTTSDVDALYQSIPNPTDDVALINYYLTKEYTNAIITVSTQEGKILHSFKLEPKMGNGSVKVSLGSLASGTYFYTLVAGERVIDTKKLQIIK